MPAGPEKGLKTWVWAEGTAVQLAGREARAMPNPRAWSNGKCAVIDINMAVRPKK